MNSERWKQCIFDYEASDRGHVRDASGRRCKYYDNRGYKTVHIQGKNYRVCRLVLAAFLGPCPEGHEVNHKNGRKDDDRLSNLEYVTHAENIRHSYEIGTSSPRRIRGEQNGNARIPDHIVRAVLRECKHAPARQVAKRFGIPVGTVYGWISGKYRIDAALGRAGNG